MILRALRRLSIAGRYFSTPTQPLQPPPSPPPPSPTSPEATEIPEQPRRPITRSPIAWATVIGIGILGGSALYYFTTTAQKLEKASEIKSAGKAAIGGPFTLVRDDGEPITDAEYRGRFMLLYFGFSHCPDICPGIAQCGLCVTRLKRCTLAELRKMLSVIRRLEAKGYDQKVIVPIFISVDPARDTVEQMRMYVKVFGPELHGLTGTPAQCEAASRAYRVYASKSNDSEDNYLVDHSIVIYLVDQGGVFSEYFGKTVTADEMTTRIEKILARA